MYDHTYFGNHEPPIGFLNIQPLKKRGGGGGVKQTYIITDKNFDNIGLYDTGENFPYIYMTTGSHRHSMENS